MNASSSEPDLLNARQVANMLTISERSVWRLVSESQIPSPLHIGGSARWRRSDIEGWLQRGASDGNGNTSLLYKDQGA